MRVLLFCIIVFLFSSSKSQTFNTLKMFRSTKHGVGFKYPDNWKVQESQLSSTLILLYEMSGTQSTCNLSVVNKDRNLIEDYDTEYIKNNFIKIFPKIKNITNKIKAHLGQNISVSTFESEMSLSNKDVDVKSFVVIMLRKNYRYMLVVNSPLNMFDKIVNDVNVIYGTLGFDNIKN